ncbi:MAG: HEPN domain-containing protein [Deltaproteobacteria bacterium]|nr:HEPN domain-containing protein [Deltaproteobacteria bacterium]
MRAPPAVVGLRVAHSFAARPHPCHGAGVADAPAIAPTWLEEPEADWRAAQVSLVGAAYNWTCFRAQPAGEDALKAWMYACARTSIVTL